MNNANNQTAAPWWVAWSPLMVMAVCSAIVLTWVVADPQVLKGESRWAIVAIVMGGLLVSAALDTFGGANHTLQGVFSLLCIGVYVNLRVDRSGLAPAVDLQWTSFVLPLCAYGLGLLLGFLARLLARQRGSSSRSSRL